MKRGFFLTLLLLCTLCAAPRAEAVKISIEIPSVRETVLASGRDFYVAGRIDRDIIARTAAAVGVDPVEYGMSIFKCRSNPAELPVDIRVEVAVAGLMRDGIRIPLRAVESRVDKASGLTPRRDIWFRYEGRAPWAKLSPDELMASPPPDLVYRHGDPQSFYDPRLKAAVTENGYAALIQGGCTKDFDSGYKNLYKDDLEWKYFRVTVSAVSGGRVLAERHVDVMLGSVPDKMLARFSPAAHMKKVQRTIKRRRQRLLKRRADVRHVLGILRVDQFVDLHCQRIHLFRRCKYCQNVIRVSVFFSIEKNVTQAGEVYFHCAV